MCTIVHVVLPPAADADGVRDAHRGAQGRPGRLGGCAARSDTDLTAAGMLRDREQVYMRIVPWKNLSLRLVTGSLRGACAQRAARPGLGIAVGLLLFEDGGPARDDTRRETVRPNVFAERGHTTGDVLYIVQPDRSPPKVVPRHGPADAAKRRREAPPSSSDGRVSKRRPSRTGVRGSRAEAALFELCSWGCG